MSSCLNHCYALASNSYLLFSWKPWPLTRISCLIHPIFMATYLPQLHLKSESDSHSVVPDSATLCTVACQAPVHGILQVRLLEWVAIPFSGDLPDPGVEPRSPALKILYHLSHQETQYHHSGTQARAPVLSQNPPLPIPWTALGL